MADIKFRLGLEGKDFDKGLDDRKKKATAWAGAMDDIGKKIQRSWGAGDVFKGLLQGIGIGSVEKVVDLLTSGFKAAADHAKDLATWSEKSLDAVLRLIRNRRTDEQNLAALQREQRRDNRALVAAKIDGAFSVGPNREAEMQAAEITARMSERAVEVDELQRKIDKEAQQRAKELADARSKLADAKQAEAREEMSDEEKLVSLDIERAKWGLEGLNTKITELERVKAQTKEYELQRQIVALTRKIAEEEARTAEKAANEQKRRREEAERLNKELTRARKIENETRAEIRNARAEQFAFTLQDASEGRRGGPAGRGRARLFDQKTKQLNQIVDRGDLQVAFGDDGQPTLSSRNGGNADSARQATARFRKLFNDREALRGSINNLTSSDKDPVAQQKKAYKDALDESKRLEEMQKALAGKFTNQ